MKNQAGFTLIELLIVIAVIGILAVTLFPNLLAAQKRAYDVSALSCATTLVKAVSVYRIDHPETSVVPPLSSFYGTADAEETYGTNVCDGMALQDLSQPDHFKFEVRHPNGKKIYTVTENGLSIGS